jgi:SAM-dependent methyltransferase
LPVPCGGTKERKSLTQSEDIYNSSRLATGYAYNRPAIHARLIEVARKRLDITHPLGRALDVGCGAGLSTVALGPLAQTVVGLEPAKAMLVHSHVVAPQALFLVGQAERLPFSAGTFDLIAAAGSLNYVDADLFLPEATRVLVPQGLLIIYDFSAGRRARGDGRLDQWFNTFEYRYPPPPDYELDVKNLPYGRFGLRLDGYEELEVGMPMRLSNYLCYVLSEANVEWAILHGQPEKEIREWCQGTLGDVFRDKGLEVLFEAYVACVRRDKASLLKAKL